MEKIETLWEEVRELCLGNTPCVERLESPPSSLCFLRDFVSRNKPCIISNAILHWHALTYWKDPTYLTRTFQNSPPISLHITPNGRADALAPHPNFPNSLCFASAAVCHVPFAEALRRIDESSDLSVAYAQQQNDCFRSEYASLSNDIDPELPWASEALGFKPDAINIWIGNQHSETSYHKDHYENLYVVVTGEKHFLLLPPTDVHRMYVCDYPTAQYIYSDDNGEFKLKLDDPKRTVPWCSVNPYPSLGMRDKEMSKFPLYFNGPKPFECNVKAGEILYLPSMWFHHVRQSPDNSGRTIAVNYWYDMQFDIKYAYFNFLQSIDYPSSEQSELLSIDSKNSTFCVSEDDEYEEKLSIKSLKVG